MRKSKSREEGEIGSESGEKGDLLPCSSPLISYPTRAHGIIFNYLKASNVWSSRSLSQPSPSLKDQLTLKYTNVSRFFFLLDGIT